MKDQIISFETAELAKEKGFDVEPNHLFYVTENIDLKTIPSWRRPSKHYHWQLKGALVDEWEHLDETCCPTHDVPNENMLAAPTQSLLQKWLRDVHNIHCFADCVNGIGSRKGWFFDAQIPFTNKHLFPHSILIDDNNNTITYDTYEEALEKGLQEALKMIGV